MAPMTSSFVEESGIAAHHLSAELPAGALASIDSTALASSTFSPTLAGVNDLQQDSVQASPWEPQEPYSEWQALLTTAPRRSQSKRQPRRQPLSHRNVPLPRPIRFEKSGMTPTLGFVGNKRQDRLPSASAAEAPGRGDGLPTRASGFGRYQLGGPNGIDGGGAAGVSSSKEGNGRAWRKVSHLAEEPAPSQNDEADLLGHPFVRGQQVLAPGAGAAAARHVVHQPPVVAREPAASATTAGAEEGNGTQPAPREGGTRAFRPVPRIRIPSRAWDGSVAAKEQAGSDAREDTSARSRQREDGGSRANLRSAPTTQSNDEGSDVSPRAHSPLTGMRPAPATDRSARDPAVRPGRVPHWVHMRARAAAHRFAEAGSYDDATNPMGQAGREGSFLEHHPASFLDGAKRFPLQYAEGDVVGEEDDDSSPWGVPAKGLPPLLRGSDESPELSFAQALIRSGGERRRRKSSAHAPQRTRHVTVAPDSSETGGRFIGFNNPVKEVVGSLVVGMGARGHNSGAVFAERQGRSSPPYPQAPIRQPEAAIVVPPAANTNAATSAGHGGFHSPPGPEAVGIDARQHSLPGAAPAARAGSAGQRRAGRRRPMELLEEAKRGNPRDGRRRRAVDEGDDDEVAGGRMLRSLEMAPAASKRGGGATRVRRTRPDRYDHVRQRGPDLPPLGGLSAGTPDGSLVDASRLGAWKSLDVEEDAGVPQDSARMRPSSPHPPEGMPLSTSAKSPRQRRARFE